LVGAANTWNKYQARNLDDIHNFHQDLGQPEQAKDQVNIWVYLMRGKTKHLLKGLMLTIQRHTAQILSEVKQLSIKQEEKVKDQEETERLTHDEHFID